MKKSQHSREHYSHQPAATNPMQMLDSLQKINEARLREKTNPLSFLPRTLLKKIQTFLTARRAALRASRRKFFTIPNFIKNSPRHWHKFTKFASGLWRTIAKAFSDFWRKNDFNNFR